MRRLFHRLVRNEMKGSAGGKCSQEGNFIPLSESVPLLQREQDASPTHVNGSESPQEGQDRVFLTVNRSGDNLEKPSSVDTFASDNVSGADLQDRREVIGAAIEVVRNRLLREAFQKILFKAADCFLPLLEVRNKMAQAHCKLAFQAIFNQAFPRITLYSPSSRFIIPHSRKELSPTTFIAFQKQPHLPLREQASMNFSDFTRQQNTSQKTLLKKIFVLETANKVLTAKVRQLSNSLDESLRRQEKEMQKKRESLEMLAEQITEKNEVIDELKMTIRCLQTKCGSSHKLLEDILEQDPQNLKKTVFRLENINEKLNMDVGRFKKDKEFFEEANNRLRKEIEEINAENAKLLASNFEMESTLKSIEAREKELAYKIRKFQVKLQRNRKVSKMCCNLLRGQNEKQICEITLKSEKPSLEEIKVSSLFECDLEEKLENVFTYLFRIDEKDYTLQGNFDQDERNLLSTLKSKFNEIGSSYKLENIMEGLHAGSQRPDLIEYFAKFQEASVLSFFGETNHRLPHPVEDHVSQATSQMSHTSKVLALEVQKQKHIQKIGEMKDLHMHIRSIIMNLLKSLEVKNLKRQTEQILALLMDIFEYSEGEKAVMFPPPKQQKRLFGFI